MGSGELRPTKLIRTKKRNILEFDNLIGTSYIFEISDPENVEIYPFLFESGYLTIKETYTRNERKRYRLDCPNKEVKDSLTRLGIQNRA